MAVPPTGMRGGDYTPEDKDQALVQTPYGKGMVVRSRKNGKTDSVSMREIELTDWAKRQEKNGPQVPSMLYSPTEFPSVEPTVGSEVKTLYGRGKVGEVREDGFIVVQISSWRLRGRSQMTCCLKSTEVQVVRPKKIYEMTVVEKVEHAQELKEQAAAKFAKKDYEEALQLYATSVDTIKYVQHKKESSNEIRGDLLMVMVTCCNNAGTCCLHLRQWDRAQKFGKNGLVLLEALQEKQGNSKILELLNREGVENSKLFGAWKAKSYIIVARGLAERHSTDEAIENLKKGLETIAEYKNENDSMYQQLQRQEKEIRKLLTSCKERRKAEKKREVARAKAMFGGSTAAPPKKEDKTKENESASDPVSVAQEAVKEQVLESEPESRDVGTGDANEAAASEEPLKKRVSFADGSTPGSVDDADNISFFDEHKEALLLLGGVVLGSAVVHLMFRKRQ